MNYYVITIKTKIHSIFSTKFFHTVLSTNMILVTYFQSIIDISYISYCSQMFCWFLIWFFYCYYTWKLNLDLHSYQ